MNAETTVVGHDGADLRAGGHECPFISVAIKCLNEEAKIARCIESTIAALREIPYPSEIVLADSVSTDRTIEIASRYPIKIVQFAHANERGCGAGVQLGYQHTRGDFIMLLDGDMELLPGFLPKAVAKLIAEPRLAGVAGLVEDTSIVNTFDRNRVVQGAWNRPLLSAQLLNGGGLYRRIAIDAVGGYAADRNLKAWEEAELGMRLTTMGWKLERMNFPSTLHTGHSASGLELLRSMWRSRRAMANGVLIKQSLGKPWMHKALRRLLHPILIIGMWVGAFGAIILSLMSSKWDWISGYCLAVVTLVLLFAIYKRSLRSALVSFGMWHFMAASLILGLGEETVSPGEQIASVELSSALRG